MLLVLVQQSKFPVLLLFWYQVPEVMAVFLAGFTLVRNLTLRRGPVCHSSSGLYSEQDQISVALSQNGCETAGGRGCVHGDICASITRYEICFAVLLFRVYLDFLSLLSV